MVPNITTNRQQEFENLQSRIEDFRQQLKSIDYINDQKNFFVIMHDFWDFLGGVRDEQLCGDFMQSEYFATHRMFFHSLEHYYTRAVEVAEAFSIITKQLSKKLSFMDLFQYPISKATYQQTNHEMQMLDFSHCERMVIVGCGCLPETILYIYENSPVKEIMGIDDNQEAIFIAGEMIRSQNLSDIHLLHYNSINYDYKDADIVLVTNMMRDKKGILDRIEETASEDIQILARTPIFLGHMFYEDATDSLNERLTVKKRERVSDYFLEETVLIDRV